MNIQRVKFGWLRFGLLAACSCGAPGTMDELGEVTAQEFAAIENGTPVLSDDRGACKLSTPRGTCTANLITNSWAFSAHHCITDTTTSMTLRCPADGNTPIEITDFANNVFKRPSHDLMLMRLPRRVSVMGGTYTVNNTFFPLSDTRLLNQSVYCLGYGPNPGSPTADTLTSGQFNVTAIGSLTVTTSRNALDQLPIHGDSGGTCFYDGQRVGTKASYMIGVYSGNNAPGPDGKSPTANYVNPKNYREWVDQTLFAPPATAGAGATSSPAIVATGQESLTAFIRKSDNAIYARDYRNGAWMGTFTSIGGAATSEPAAASYAPGKFVVAIRDSANNVQFRDYNGTSYGSWTSIGGPTSTEPAVAATGGALFFFAISSGTLKARIRDANNTWSAWLSAPASPFGTLGPELTAVAVANDKVSVLTRMADGTINHIQLQAGVFSNWVALHGSFKRGPAATSSAPGRIDLFAVKQDGTLAYRRNINGWDQDWTNLGGIVNDSIAATSRGVGSMDVVYTNALGTVAHRRYAP
jgi:hypothetical protein